MIVVKVTYTVNPGFVSQNRENIKTFMADFKKLESNEFRYNVYMKADGQTFVHLSHFDNEVVQQNILNTPSFKQFQLDRDTLGLVSQPRIEEMTFIGATVHPLQENYLDASETTTALK